MVVCELIKYGGCFIKIDNYFGLVIISAISICVYYWLMGKRNKCLTDGEELIDLLV
ncbi:hypothetical protein TUM4261_00100 [Shewanella sp. c952]|nr:hypothetical protein TUM4261_00100 [Shewanella sp. c952]